MHIPTIWVIPLPMSQRNTHGRYDFCFKQNHPGFWGPGFAHPRRVSRPGRHPGRQDRLRQDGEIPGGEDGVKQKGWKKASLLVSWFSWLVNQSLSLFFLFCCLGCWKLACLCGLFSSLNPLWWLPGDHHCLDRSHVEGALAPGAAARPWSLYTSQGQNYGSVGWPFASEAEDVRCFQY